MALNAEEKLATAQRYVSDVADHFDTNSPRHGCAPYNKEAEKLVKGTPKSWQPQLVTELYSAYLRFRGVTPVVRSIKEQHFKSLCAAADQAGVLQVGYVSGLTAPQRDFLWGAPDGLAPDYSAFKLRLELWLKVAKITNIPNLAKKAGIFQAFAETDELAMHGRWVLGRYPVEQGRVPAASRLLWSLVFLQMLGGDDRSHLAVDDIVLSEPNNENARRRAFVAYRFVLANRKNARLAELGERLRATYPKEWLEEYAA